MGRLSHTCSCGNCPGGFTTTEKVTRRTVSPDSGLRSPSVTGGEAPPSAKVQVPALFWAMDKAGRPDDLDSNTRSRPCSRLTCGSLSGPESKFISVRAYTVTVAFPAVPGK